MTPTTGNSLQALEPRRLLSTYFVAPTGSDDSGDGSAAHPYATIQFAGALTHPGDTVDVEPGSYVGFVFGWDSTPASASDRLGVVAGTAADPITIQADPAAAAGSVLITTRDQETPDGIDLEPGCNDVIIKGFTVNNTDASLTRAGIRVTQSDDVQVLDNTVHDAGTWGIFTAFGTGLVIDGNTATDSQSQHGIYVSNSAVDPTIEGNICYGNAECGIQLNGDASQGDTGIITGALIAGNILYNNGLSGASAINCDGMVDSTIENNLLYDNHSSGISLFQEDGATGSTGNVVVNNTIDMAADARWAVNINSGSTGNTLFDNILLNQSASHGDILVDSSSVSGFTSDDNITDGRFDVGDGSEVLTLAQWRQQTGQDDDSAVATEAALFQSASADNFALLAGSPAATVGVASFEGKAAPATDLTGAARTAPSAGAYTPGSTDNGSTPTGGGGGGSVSTPPTVPPAAPTSLHATTHAGDAALTWTDNSAGQASFELQKLVTLPRASVHAKVVTAFTDVAALPAGTTAFDTTGLLPLHKYTWRVEAIDAGGTSNSASLATVTKRLGRPAAPAAVTATAINAADVALTWADPSADTDLLVGFRIYRRRMLGRRGGKFTLIATVGTGTSAYTDSAALGGNTYQYRIAAVNKAAATISAPATANTATG